MYEASDVAPDASARSCLLALGTIPTPFMLSPEIQGWKAWNHISRLSYSMVLNTDEVLPTRSMRCRRQKGGSNHSPAAVMGERQI